jgi:phage-related protein
MAEVARAYVTIIPSMEGAQQSITEQLSGAAGSASDEVGKKSGGLFSSSFAKGLASGAAAITAAASATIGTVVAEAGKVAELGDEIDKNSQKLGVSSKFYQEWDAVLQHSGTSMSNMTSTFKTLANASQDASAQQQAAFEALGLSMEQVQSMSTEELFESVIAGLQGMEEGTERTAIATDLLGKGAMEMGALLNTSAEDTQAMIDTVNKLGGVMSEEGVKAAAQYQDSLQDMQTVFDGLKNNLIADFLPSMSTVMNGVTDLVSGSADGMETIEQGLDMFFEGLSEKIPVILDIGTKAIITLITAITNHLPQILQTGVNVLLQLITGISKTIPDLVPQMVKAMTTMITTITSNLPQIITAGMELLGALIQGIINSIPDLIAAVPQIISSLVNSFIAHGPDMLSIGENLVVGIWNGLASATSWLYNKVSEWASNIVRDIKSFFGIHSPSTVMAEMGRFLDEGLAKGIDDEITTVEDAASGLKDAVTGELAGVETTIGANATISASALYDLHGAGSDTALLISALDRIGELIENIDPDIKIDGKSLADKISKYQRRTARALT